MRGLYRALLRLYPESFRNEYGDELWAVFGERRARASGVFALLLLAADLTVETFGTAAAIHWDILRQDLRYTMRALRRSVAFAVTAVLVVALGVGANTAAFSLADFVLLRPLPFPEPDRLFTIWQSTAGYPQLEPSPPNYRDWRLMNRSFEAMGAFTGGARNLVGAGDPVHVEITEVAHDVLALLRVRARLGRSFEPSDSAAGAQPAVLSYGLWHDQFGGDATVLGRKITLDGKPHVVLGVMPPSFRYPGRETQLWTLLRLSQRALSDRTDNYLNVVGRLRDGVSLEQAQADMARIGLQLRQQFPKENEATTVRLTPVTGQVPQRARLLILALCGAALCILLLACANIANLLLARAVNRERELAVRAALGAGRERLVRQLVTESFVLAALGGTVGVLVAIISLPLLSRLVPLSLPTAEEPSIDMRIVVFATMMTAITSIAFGVFPAIRAGGRVAFAALRDGGRSGGGRRRARAVLVTVQIAASLVLVVSSGLLLRAMWRVQSIDPGFTADDLLTLRTALPTPKYATVARRNRFLGGVLDRVRTLPGVTDAAYASHLPMVARGGIWPVTIAGEEILVRDFATSASLRYVTPRFFATMRIPIRRGRDVAESDGQDRPFVAVVSQSFVERYWPNENPIGKRFKFAFDERTVVGVVGDVRVRGLERESEPQVYIPYQQVADSSLLGYAPKELVIRTSGPMFGLLASVREAVRAVDPDQPISAVRMMTDVIDGETASRRAQLRVLGILGLVALLLAGVGIHGLVSFTVAHRTPEIGVRLALGAQPGAILRMVLRDGVVLAIVGVIPGLVLAYFGARGMEALLFGVQPADLWTMMAAVGLCCVTTIVGSLRPALRAARIDPISAMRAD